MVRVVDNINQRLPSKSPCKIFIHQKCTKIVLDLWISPRNHKLNIHALLDQLIKGIKGPFCIGQQSFLTKKQTLPMKAQNPFEIRVINLSSDSAPPVLGKSFPAGYAC